MGFDFTMVCPEEFRHLGITRVEHTPSFRVITLPRLFERTVLPGIMLRSALGPLVYGIGKMDLVHVCAPAFPETWIAASIARRAGKPLVVDIDDWWGIDPDGIRARMESRMEEAFERNAVGGADRLVVASGLLMDKVNGYSGREAAVIPNGIDTGDFASISRQTARAGLLKRIALPESSLIVVTLADSSHSRLFSELGRRLHEDGRNVYLLVVGAGGREEEVSNIVHLPKMERGEWLSTLVGSDASLLLMRSTIWERARFPIKLAEYMATGNPVISSSVGESRRILDEAGYSSLNGALYTDNSVGGIVGAVTYILDNPDEVRKVSLNAMRYAKNRLSWENIASEYIQTVGPLMDASGSQ